MWLDAPASRSRSRHYIMHFSVLPVAAAAADDDTLRLHSMTAAYRARCFSEMGRTWDDRLQ